VERDPQPLAVVDERKFRSLLEKWYEMSPVLERSARSAMRAKDALP
jgi:hypothetical protein